MVEEAMFLDYLLQGFHLGSVSICFQVFTGAYLAVVDFMNFIFILFPVCGSKSKSKSGECMYVAIPFAFILSSSQVLSAHSGTRSLRTQQKNEAPALSHMRKMGP